MENLFAKGLKEMLRIKPESKRPEDMIFGGLIDIGQQLATNAINKKAAKDPEFATVMGGFNAAANAMSSVAFKNDQVVAAQAPAPQNAERQPANNLNEGQINLRKQFHDSDDDKEEDNKNRTAKKKRETKQSRKRKESSSESEYCNSSDESEYEESDSDSSYSEHNRKRRKKTKKTKKGRGKKSGQNKNKRRRKGDSLSDSE